MDSSTDNELLYLIEEGNDEAYNLLFKRYNKYIISLANKYIIPAKNVGLDKNDLIQEGMIGLSSAIKLYKDTKDAKFSTYALLCIKNRVIASIQNNNRLKDKALNESKSLDYNYEDSDNSLIDFIQDDRINPENLIIDKETEERISNILKSNLSEFEKQIFDLKLYGLDYTEIGLLLNKSYKSIASAYARIQNKLKNSNINVD